MKSLARTLLCANQIQIYCRLNDLNHYQAKGVDIPLVAKISTNVKVLQEENDQP